MSTPSISGLFADSAAAAAGTSSNTSSTSGASGSTAPGSTASPTDALGRDAFLNLLVTQLQNQDPLQPQDNSAFIAQLAQFSALEQTQGARQDLDQILTILQAVQNLAGQVNGGSGTGATSSTPTTPATQSPSAIGS